MNPREFCRIPGYDVAICLTYSFDPIFFERVVIHDLFAGGATDILVVGDRGQVEDALNRVLGQVVLLGRRYQLATLTVDRTLHTKVVARIGKTGAILLVGSNNLTASGWGANRELATAWQIDASDTAAAFAVKDLLVTTAELLPPLSRRVVERALQYDWLKSTDGASGPVMLITSFEYSLGSQLSDRWHGRHFESLKVMTGSTDQGGAMLRWAASEFGVKSAVVAVDPQRSDFAPAQLSKLPLRLKIVPLSPRPLPHAKFAFFESPNGCAAVVGSANCSAAAWVQTPKSGGNIESVVVYDQCVPEQFATALAVFEDTQVAPESVTNWHEESPSVPDTPQRAGPSLLELVISRASAQVLAETDVPVDLGAIVQLEIAGEPIPLRASDEAGLRWAGPLPNAQSAWTLFGRLRIRTKGSEWLTGYRWANDEQDLEYGVRGRKISNSIQGLGAPPPEESQQRKLIEELIAVAHTLLSEVKAFPDPLVVQKGTTDEPKKPAKSADPDSLVRSIEDLHAAGHPQANVGRLLSLPISGVMSVLFGPEVDEFGAATLIEPPNGDSPNPPKGPPKPSTPPKVVPPEKLRQKLKTEIATFLTKLLSGAFAEQCTAAQMVQATAFPIAVAIKAGEGGWISQETAASWVFTVCDVLFQTRKATKNGSPRDGLLASVRARYERDDRGSVFSTIVGDGRLWITMTTALTLARSWSQRREAEWSLAVRDVYREPLLSESVDLSKLSGLISQLTSIVDGRAALVDSSKIAQVIRRIEARLAEQQAHFSAKQAGSTHHTGDLLWRPGVGFGWAEEDIPIHHGMRLRAYIRKRGEAVTVAANLFINVRVALRSDPVLGVILHSLEDWPSSPNADPISMNPGLVGLFNEE